jgi:hypothetical protein
LCASVADFRGLPRARSQAAGTAPDIVRASKRHVDTLSEDEYAWEKVELLRGSEDDFVKQSTRDERLARLSDPAHSDPTPVETRIKTDKGHRESEMYHHNSVVRDFSSALYFGHQLHAFRERKRHFGNVLGIERTLTASKWGFSVRCTSDVLYCIMHSLWQDLASEPACFE